MKINRMRANFFVLHGLYSKALKEYKKGLKRNPEDKLLKDMIPKLKQEINRMHGQRRFKCIVCGLEFEVSHGTGQRGDQMHCPSCGAQVYRIDSGGGGRGRGHGGGSGQGGRGRGQCIAGKGSNGGTDTQKAKVQKSGKTEGGK